MDAIPTNHDPARIIDLVSDRTGVRSDLLRSSRNRHRQVVRARVVATGLLHEVALLSLSQVGPLMGSTGSVAHHRWRRWLAMDRAEREKWAAAARGAAA